MRILLITQLFQPEPNHLKGLAFARELVKQGHEVQVLTGFPNYPGGKIYDGYSMSAGMRERLEGVEVVRVPSYLSHSRSGAQRALSYVSFALSATFLGLPRMKRPDVVHVYQGPATLALPAMALRALRGVPFVLDVQDLWPESVTDSGMMRLPVGKGLLDRWCRLTYRLASRIVVLSDGYGKLIAERGAPAERIDVVHNWCDESGMTASVAGDAPRLDPNGFNVVYAGNMGALQDLGTAIEAAVILERSGAPIRIVLVGDGVELDRLKSMVRDRGVGNVDFIPRQSSDRVASILAQANLLLVHLKDTPLSRVGIPQKTQAYLAAGRPVLMAMHGCGAELVVRAGGGVACAPGDPHAMARSIAEVASMSEDARQEMARKGMEFYRRELSFAVGTKRMSAVFAAAAGDHR